jgi:hypothetical protein
MWRLILLLSCLVLACEVDVAPAGLRATPAGNGPVVRFDPQREVPLPNDVSTTPDPTSRTGRRPSLGQTGATALERELRADVGAMEGWGLSSAITVGFDREPSADVRLPAIDADAVLARMSGDDPSNDPFYVVNLTTGIPVLLDVGHGYSPTNVPNSGAYGPLDPKASESNLVFETEEEGADLPFFAYTPAKDRDFDGVLDHPNTRDWYERETDTLILRPIVPLAEMTEYAVVLTDRLRAPDGQLIRSPFEAIHHPTQRSGIARLQDFLTDNRLATYYGDIAGTGLDHVAFAWTFTTQPAKTALQGLRDQLPTATLVTTSSCSTTALPNVDHLEFGLVGSVPWAVALPKGKSTPSPVLLWVGAASDVFVYGDDYARQGVAFLAFGDVAIDATCKAQARARTPWFTGRLAHDRDTIRQRALDGFSLMKALKGNALGLGPTYFAAGIGIDGVAATMMGALEPSIVATAPIATGAGLVYDVALRSSQTAPLGPILGPWVYAVPASERPASACLPDQRSVRITDGTNDEELACVDASDLGTGVSVLVRNATAAVSRCARTSRDGRFGVAIPSTNGDHIEVQVYNAPDVFGTYGRCNPKEGAPLGRSIDSFELRAGSHDIGERLVTDFDGMGLRRQSPELRRFRDLAQAILDPADPGSFAGLFAPRSLLVTTTAGDTEFPLSSSLLLARAASVLPYLAPNAADDFPAYANAATPRDFYTRLGQKTPLAYLLEARSGAGPNCKANVRSECPATGERSVAGYACKTAPFDPDWVSEGALPFDEPHPDVPLRLARLAVLTPTDLAASWVPRLAGVPFAPDAAGWTAIAPVSGLFELYVDPSGAHGWGAHDACRVWDPAAYGNALLARFFATSGRDIYYLSHPNSHACLASGTCFQ